MPQYTDWKIIVMDNTTWQLNDANPGSLDVQCTGLGGGEHAEATRRWTEKKGWVEENSMKTGMCC